MEIAQQLIQLATAHALMQVARTEPIAQSGSNRVYLRLIATDGSTLIGAYNEDVRENEAFFAFTNFFQQENIPVPTIVAISTNRRYYLQTDLGDETLFSYLQRRKQEQNNGVIPDDVLHYFRKVLHYLPRLQLCGRKGIDFSVCYPRAAFDRQSMQWDLNYFKYYFLKLAHIPFDEQALEEDFATLIQRLETADSNYFLFRDLQSRNIMLKDGEVYFIDYQGGRRGALPYDVASLLYQAKAELPADLRAELLEYYLDELAALTPVNRAEFRQHYANFVLIRLLQVLGAYGYRGYYEKKSHFLQSIPPAVENLRQLIKDETIIDGLPTLSAALHAITAKNWNPQTNFPANQLTVEVMSFSYKKGLPEDKSDNGGGFIFDCRALPNPGREAAYKTLTGKDLSVIQYLEAYPVVAEFKQHLFAIVDMSVDNYLQRHFTHLSVACGCTGGQHRSVYFAESIAQHIREKYPEVNLLLHHREQEKDN